MDFPVGTVFNLRGHTAQILRVLLLGIVGFLMGVDFLCVPGVPVTQGAPSCYSIIFLSVCY